MNKFTKEDIHAKFLSDDIDSAIYRKLSSLQPDIIAVILADRLGELLVSIDNDVLVNHCIELIQHKVDANLESR